MADKLSTKQRLAQLLETNENEFVSGEEIAENLGITRAAIWKNIHQLEDEGYTIEAVTNKGYRLAPDCDVASESGIKRYLGDLKDAFHIEVFDQVVSTNNLLKDRAGELQDWTVIVSRSQTAGKGRSGRSFYSPVGTGLYLSVLQRPKLPADKAARITTAAAVAACMAIEECGCTEYRPEIKWVNDVFVNSHKVCGILTEASLNMESGNLDWAVMGIGFNIYEPEGGFPEDIAMIAGPVAQYRQRDLKNKLAASFIRLFREMCLQLETPTFTEEYRKRSFLIGQKINVLKPDGPVPATALDVDDECHLIVRYLDGKMEALSSGEVSVRPVK